MRRAQLYLDDDLWGALHRLARRDNTTISELFRQAVRERYLGDLEQRKSAMQAFVGTRMGRPVRQTVIAATAEICGAPLWTRNRKHYPTPEVTH